MSAATVVRLPAGVGKTAAGVAAIVTLCAALSVIAFGVIATSGDYGSRMAWLLGVALPLLGISAFLSWSARPVGAAPSDRRRPLARTLFVAAVTLFAIPFALAIMVFAVDALLVAFHEVRLLF